MKTSQTYRAALIAAHTIDSAPRKPKSASGVMQRLGVALLACALVIGGTGSASANEARNEAAVRVLRLSFRRVPNSEHPYSPKTEPS